MAYWIQDLRRLVDLRRLLLENVPALPISNLPEHPTAFRPARLTIGTTRCKKLYSLFRPTTKHFIDEPNKFCTHVLWSTKTKKICYSGKLYTACTHVWSSGKGSQEWWIKCICWSSGTGGIKLFSLNGW